MNSCGSTLAVITFLISFAVVPASAQRAPVYAGRPVADVLRELQSPTLRIIFSSDLVPPTLLVKAEPKAATHATSRNRSSRRTAWRSRQDPAAGCCVVALTRDAPPRPPPRRSPPAADQSPSARVAAARQIRIEERVDVTDRLERTSATGRLHARADDDPGNSRGIRERAAGAAACCPARAATNDETASLLVRGAGPEHNMIVVDGVQIHNPHRLGEFTSSFLNPATAASVALDPSGLDARYGGRLSSVTIIDTRDGGRIARSRCPDRSG